MDNFSRVELMLVFMFSLRSTPEFYFVMLLRDEIFFATIALFHTCDRFMSIFHNMMPYCRWKICDLAKEQSPAQIEEFPRGKDS